MKKAVIAIGILSYLVVAVIDLWAFFGGALALFRWDLPSLGFFVVVGVVVSVAGFLVVVSTTGVVKWLEKQDG